MLAIDRSGGKPARAVIGGAGRPRAEGAVADGGRSRDTAAQAGAVADSWIQPSPGGALSVRVASSGGMKSGSAADWDRATMDHSNIL